MILGLKVYSLIFFICQSDIFNNVSLKYIYCMLLCVRRMNINICKTKFRVARPKRGKSRKGFS